jgi:hypothetical protein
VWNVHAIVVAGRERRIARYVAEETVLSPADAEKIRTLMAEGREIEAVRLYKRCTRAELVESRRAVRILAGSAPEDGRDDSGCR